MKIVMTKRTADIHVCPEGKPGIWAAGKTVDEAVGNLIQCHQEHFGLELEWNKTDTWTQRYIAGDHLTRK